MAMVVAGEREALERQGLSTDVLHARLLQSFRTGNRRGHARCPGRCAAGGPALGLLGRRRANARSSCSHGTDDQVVPPAHAHWYAAHLPCARLAMTPGELHLSMCFRSAGRIQESCRELAAPPARASKAVALLAEAEAY